MAKIAAEGTHPEFNVTVRGPVMLGERCCIPIIGNDAARR